jgi:dihydrofolate synthase / folylpolyglutamate synthase
MSLMTNVNYDHSGTLGRTLPEIAWQKAGVIKEGSIFWTSEQDPELLDILIKECEKKNALFNQVTAAVKNSEGLNSYLAYEAAKDLGIEEKYILKSIEQARMPARFELMQKNPLVVVDAAHNLMKMKNTVNNLEDLTYKKLHLILSIAPRPDLREVLKVIAKQADTIWLTKCSPNSMEPREISQLLNSIGYKGKKEIELDPTAAVKSCLKQSKKSDLILATGSFYLAGYIRRLWYSEEQVLKKRSSF